MARIEHDFIGDLEVPANAYYGVQSLRGKETSSSLKKRTTKKSTSSSPLLMLRKQLRWLIRNSALLNPKLPTQLIWACDQLINNTEKYRDQFIT